MCHTSKNDLNISFLKGPIPWPWLMAAARLGASCVEVSILIWLLAGLCKRKDNLKLQKKLRESLCLSRHRVHRALWRLEAGGLIKTENRHGASPIISILSTEDESQD